MLHVGFLLLVSSWVFLKLCGAQDIKCNVTQDGGRTRYSVPEFKGTDCCYSWSNNTNVLANQRDLPDDQVLEQSNRTLLTSSCSELILYSRICSEGVKREATCNTICSGNAGLQNGGEIQTAIPTEIPENHWIGPTVALLLLVVLLVVLGLLCYKFRDNIRRKITNLYTSVETEYEMTDVEEQRG